MEYTIYNESLVYYVLKDPISGKYLHYAAMQGPLGVSIENADKRESIRDIAELRKFVSKENPQLKDLQIRKVKVIDIGEVNHN